MLNPLPGKVLEEAQVAGTPMVVVKVNETSGLPPIWRGICYLDVFDLEDRSRVLTINQNQRYKGMGFLINMIDSPGYLDVSYGR